MTAATRRESDLLGTLDVPAEAYYGIHTMRALENFPISGVSIRVHADLIVGLAQVKQAAAMTNGVLGELRAEQAGAIEAACKEITAGRLHGQFVVDVVQGGAGTSTNMNANEVIANRALELLGYARGDYGRIHPNDHVNRHQSTNDVYPTALRLAALAGIDRLVGSVQLLAKVFAEKSSEFSTVLKLGRTQLQDAVPMTLGQEFSAFSVTLEEEVARLREASSLLREVNLGGTAIGTGISAPGPFRARVVESLQRVTGIRLVRATNLVEASWDVGAFVQLSASVKRTALKLSKIASDLRLLASGPDTGFGEISLPAVQAGSSLMPGKVNPVVPEVVDQVAFDVVGRDVAVSMAANAGQLQLNAFMPTIAHSVLTSLRRTTAACDVLESRCVRGITTYPDRLRERVARSTGLATALIGRIGYDESTAIAKEARRTGRSVLDVVVARGLMREDEAWELLDPDHLACG